MFIKNLIFKIIYFLILIYILIFVPTIFGHKPLVVISNSMNPILKVGGILYYENIDLNELKVGDILVYKTKAHIISHRIVEIKEEGFITKGDANNTIDSNLINKNQVLGKGTNWSIPYLGYYADFIYTHKYLLVISIGILTIDFVNEKKEGKRYEKKIE